MTYRQLASQLGIGVDAARHKAKRRKWPIKPGNHPSEPVRVQVPASELIPDRSPGDHIGDPRSIPGGSPDDPPGITRLIPDRSPPRSDIPPSLVTNIFTELHRQIAIKDAAFEQERSNNRQEIARIDTLYKTSLDRLLAQITIERALLLERIDNAELRAEKAEDRAEKTEKRLDQILNELLRFRKISWWRRLTGM